MNTFEVRRNRTLCGALGAVAALVAIAYLQRAASGGGVLDWVICALMTLIALVQLAGLVDSQTSLVAADSDGIRLRLGQEWLELPWLSVEQVVVEQRDGPIRDGRLVVVPRDLDAALDALLPSSQRTVRWQRRLHGAPLAVGFGENEMYLGSDALALAPLTRRIAFLRDGDWAVLSRTDARFFDANNSPVQREIKLTSLSGAAVGRGNYRHYMEKEMHEHTSVIGDTLHRMINPATRAVMLPESRKGEARARRGARRGARWGRP